MLNCSSSGSVTLITAKQAGNDILVGPPSSDHILQGGLCPTAPHVSLDGSQAAPICCTVPLCMFIFQVLKIGGVCDLQELVIKRGWRVGSMWILENPFKLNLKIVVCFSSKWFKVLITLKGSKRIYSFIYFRLALLHWWFVMATRSSSQQQVKLGPSCFGFPCL